MLTMLDQPLPVMVKSFNEDTQRGIVIGIGDKLDCFCILENGKIGYVPFTNIVVAESAKIVDAAHKVVAVATEAFTAMLFNQRDSL